MFDLLDELRQLIGQLEEHRFEYALCGGLAMGVHGISRATEDIDLLVRRETVSAIVGVAKDRGFDFPGPPMLFKGGVVEIHRITKISRDDTLMLDLLVVTEPLEEVWASRDRVAWQFGLIWAVSREGLAKMKMLSGRPKDLWDLERLKELEDEPG